MPFIDVFKIIIPIFALIGLGYGSAFTKLLGDQVRDALAQFAFVIVIPLFIFQKLATVEYGNDSPWGLWFSYFTGVFVAWTLGTLIIRQVFKRDSRAGVIGGISAGYANTVLIGIPLIRSVYGDQGLTTLFILLSIHLPIITIACSLLIERAAVIDGFSEKQPVLTILKSTLKNLLLNPIILAILAGIAYSFTGFSLEGIIADIIDRLASTAVPLALFSMGMSLNLYGIRGNILPGIFLTVVKLMIMPAVVFVVANFVIGLSPLWVAVATITAACPTGINAYVFANRFETGHAISANSITVSTIIAIFTTTII